MLESSETPVAAPAIVTWRALTVAEPRRDSSVLTPVFTARPMPEAPPLMTLESIFSVALCGAEGDRDGGGVRAGDEHRAARELVQRAVGDRHAGPVGAQQHRVADHRARAAAGDDGGTGAGRGGDDELLQDARRRAAGAEGQRAVDDHAAALARAGHGDRGVERRVLGVRAGRDVHGVAVAAAPAAAAIVPHVRSLPPHPPPSAATR